MNTISKNEAVVLLQKEYPQLKNINIVKQFKSEDSRIYNTFLVTSSNKGFERFIAKSFVDTKNKLLIEHKILKLINSFNTDSPKLLSPDHTPDNFLVIEFVDGENASEIAKNGKNIKSLFYEAGTVTGKLHNIKAPCFGDLLNEENKNWEDYLTNKLSERLLGAAKIVSHSLHNKAVDLFDSLKLIINLESKNDPILIHRDVYFDNFILKKNENKLILIDYGMAFGGRPLYDLAKFYIVELYKRPEYKDDFLNGYTKHVYLPEYFIDAMRLYILHELVGIICFTNSVGNAKYRDHAISALEELVNNKGKIIDLITK